jgi:hypothetical protein
VRSETLEMDDPRKPRGLACRTTASPRAKRERVALPLVPALVVDHRRKPALADIIGARRVRTAAMISSGSIPCR